MARHSTWFQSTGCSDCGWMETSRLRAPYRWVGMCCPNCGGYSDVHYLTMRYVYTGVWYKPWTWFRREVELKDSCRMSKLQCENPNHSIYFKHYNKLS